MEPEQEQWPENQQAFYRLAARALAFYETHPVRQVLPVLLPGAAFPDLPAEVPIPDGGTVIGTIMRPDGARGMTILDVPLPGLAILGFYARELPARGWRIDPQDSTVSEDHGKGFAEQRHVSVPTEYCWQDGAPYLRIAPIALADAPTAVHLYVKDRPPDVPYAPPLKHLGVQAGWLREEDNPFPRLQAPPGAAQFSDVSSWAHDNASASADVETEITLPELLGHYGQQLVSEGWNPVRSSVDGALAWSVWQFEKEGVPYRCLLTILRQPWLERQCHIALEIEYAVDDEREDGGWSRPRSASLR